MERTTDFGNQGGEISEVKSPAREALEPGDSDRKKLDVPDKPNHPDAQRENVSKAGTEDPSRRLEPADASKKGAEGEAKPGSEVEPQGSNAQQKLETPNESNPLSEQSKNAEPLGSEPVTSDGADEMREDAIDGEKSKLAEFDENPAIREDVLNDPDFIDEKGRLKYPDNDGFDGEPESVSLQPGTQLGRYGSEKGRFASPLGTPYEERSLPYDKESFNKEHGYEVIKEIPDVMQGRVSQHFNQPGGGEQFKLPESIGWYVDNGSLRRL